LGGDTIALLRQTRPPWGNRLSKLSIDQGERIVHNPINSIGRNAIHEMLLAHDTVRDDAYVPTVVAGEPYPPGVDAPGDSLSRLAPAQSNDGAMIAVMYEDRCEILGGNQAASRSFAY
jgi:hypothetical protein